MAELMGIVLNETPIEEEAARPAELDALHKRIADLEALLAARPLRAATASPPRSETPPALRNVVELRREQLLVSPLVVNDAGSFLDALNRKAW